MKKIKVVLADDHAIVMDGIESILNEASHVSVVGKAASAAEAETLVAHHAPDLLITDISMGEISGLELTKRITAHYPLVKVLVLSMHDSVQHITGLLEAGATGYLLKSVKQAELFTAIEVVIAGQQYIQQSLVASYTRSRQRQAEAEAQSPLTPREIEIIRLIARELTTAEISRQLYLSERTVETHRKNIFRKTGVKTAIGLLHYAREQGLL